MNETCQYMHLLLDYMLDDLDPKTKKTFEKHLADCDECLHLFAMIHKNETETNIEEIKSFEFKSKSDWQAFKKRIHENLFTKHPWTDQDDKTRTNKYILPDYQLNLKIDDNLHTRIENINPYPYTRKVKDYQINLYVVRINETKINIEINVTKNTQDFKNIYVKLIKSDWDEKLRPLKDGKISFFDLDYASYRLIIEENSQPACGIFFEITKDGLIGQ
ncbi:hypothetical protein MHK_009451 [Candidatus Magnetomorum sp. HK-1]|nr:hypothetical protein MHK_009451 [Candidatus Magnetomorum sp. HK-1]